jgi:hypothetical protein
MTKNSTDTTYPVSNQFTMHFSPYEDRLIVRAMRRDGTEINMLLTRRMVMLVLQQLLGKLPELTGLEKTPAVYWQEVLQMAHQGAMEAKVSADKALTEDPKAAEQPPGLVPTDENRSSESVPRALFLATELTTQISGEQLTLAFKGLIMPDAMTRASQPEPVFAMPLQVENVHQLIELFIDKCEQAKWHLPLELPWLETPGGDKPAGGSKKYSLLHH